MYTAKRQQKQFRCPNENDNPSYEYSHDPKNGSVFCGGEKVSEEKCQELDNPIPNKSILFDG